MEFSVDINKCLPEEISIVQSDDVSLDQQRSHLLNNNKINNQVKIELSKVVDKMGIASAKAQGLRAAITTASKLKDSNHRVYLLKGKPNYVIGMIKVGYKKLFLLDIHGQQHECEPLCVLDFYVHESQQRNGYGKKIFEYAVCKETKQPHQVAVDRPSHKFLQFLSKHYALKHPINQMNKFVVYESFFNDLAVIGEIDRRRRSAPVHRKMFIQRSRPTSRNALSANMASSSRKNIFNGDFSYTSNALDKLQNVCVKSNVTLSNNSSHGNNSRNGSSLLNQNHQQHVFVDQRNGFLRNYSRFVLPPSTRKQQKPMFVHTTINNNIVATSSQTCSGLNSSHQNFTPLDSVQSLTSHTVVNQVASILPTNTSEKSSRKNSNYIVEDLVRGISDNKQRLGTSWNVLGVPSNVSSTKNPYNKVRR